MSLVLIVEDSPTQAQQLQLILESHGLAIRIARDGREALTLLKQERVDLVLTDIVMPRLSGFELCRRIKRDPKLQGLPVIILTTLADPMDMVQALECGADNYIIKPYREDYLINRIDTILKNPASDKENKFEIGVEIQFLGKTFNVTSEKKQILNLLVSTFEDVIRANQDLKKSQEELSTAKARIDQYAHMLEGRVRSSEEKYGTLMRQANDAIVIVDASNHILEANRQAEGMFGLPEADLIGKDANFLIADADAARFAEVSSALARQGSVRGLELKLRTPAGRSVDVEICATEVVIDGQHLRMAILRDITRRRESEAKLRESEERYRQLVEGSLQGLTIMQDDRIAFCNQAYATLFGFASPDDLIGTDAAVLLDPSDRDAVVAHRHAQYRGEDVAPVLKIKGLRKDGSVIWLESMRQLMTWKGRPAVQSTCIDITNERQLEEQLLASQRMEAVGRLAGGIAHDFNNMLAVMASYGELALDQLVADNPARNDIQTILDATGRAAALTRQLLAFSRRQLLEMKLLDLNRIVSNLEKMLQRVIGEDIHLRTKLGAHLGAIRADESQIEQIIMNLTVNARDAMPTGGTLTMETARKHLDANYVKSHLDVIPGDYVMLAVTDTGTGMDEETQRRVFEPFFTTKPAGKGTGLGLSTVYGIVKQMAGLVYVYSEFGKGTCFKVYFPLDESTTRQEVLAVERAAHPRGNETILLAEDDEQVREAARRILASGGYQVLVAQNGRHAMELAQANQGRIDLLVSDVIMPGMSGKEVLDGVRQFGVSRVLFMSGYTDDSIVNHGILEGTYPFLHKPFSKDGMLSKVREVLGSPPAARP